MGYRSALLISLLQKLLGEHNLLHEVELDPPKLDHHTEF
jgi:hypothetical protein